MQKALQKLITKQVSSLKGGTIIDAFANEDGVPVLIVEKDGKKQIVGIDPKVGGKIE